MLWDTGGVCDHTPHEGDCKSLAVGVSVWVFGVVKIGGADSEEGGCLACYKMHGRSG